MYFLPIYINDHDLFLVLFIALKLSFNTGADIAW